MILMANLSKNLIEFLPSSADCPECGLSCDLYVDDEDEPICEDGQFGALCDDCGHDFDVTYKDLGLPEGYRPDTEEDGPAFRGLLTEAKQVAVALLDDEDERDFDRFRSRETCDPS